MSSEDVESITEQEEILFKQLINSNVDEQRLKVLIDLKNEILGSNRSKISLFHVGFVDTLNELLNEYSTKTNDDILIELFDCLSSFGKIHHENISDRLVELNVLEKLVHIFTSSTVNVESNERFYSSMLRCLRSLTISNKTDRTSLKLFFEDPLTLDRLEQFLSNKSIDQIVVIDILCVLSMENHPHMLKFIETLTKLLRKAIVNQKCSLSNNSSFSEQIIEKTLKFFCSISSDNREVCQNFYEPTDDENLCQTISILLTKTYRSQRISFYASKFLVHLCKNKVLTPTDPLISILSLSTLIHLSIKSSIEIRIESLQTLIDLLDGNPNLHHSTVYTEQFLRQLFTFVIKPDKSLHELQTFSLTLLAILASHHNDIQKRIAEQENLINKTIEFYRVGDRQIKLAVLRLFHGLSRSVDQLHTTFNETICDVLLDALKSDDLSLIKVSSCAISNSVLEFSTCRTKLISCGVLEILLSFLSHSDPDLMINSIWALRNLSYLSTLKIKQDIIHGLTIDRIYSLLEQATDEKFLLCLISLLRNLFHDKDMETLLPLFNVNKLNLILQELMEKQYPEKLHNEINRLIDHLNSPDISSPSHSSTDSVNSSCRPFLFPDFACDEMDQLDCS